MRMVEQRAAVIDDDVARLRFVRRSVAAYEAASRRRARFLRRSMAAHRASRRRVGLVFRAVITAALLAVVLQSDAPRAVRRRPPPPFSRPRSAAPSNAAPKVWLVEHKPAMDIYSNGLRIENEFLVNTHARAYPLSTASPGKHPERPPNPPVSSSTPLKAAWRHSIRAPISVCNATGATSRCSSPETGCIIS